MKKWFRHQWVKLLVLTGKISSWFAKRSEKKSSKYDPVSWIIARPSLDEYADDQIKALLLAVREYKKAKADPAAFVEKYFGATIAPRPGKDAWVRDLTESGMGEDQGIIGFSWDGRGRNQ